MQQLNENSQIERKKRMKRNVIKTIILLAVNTAAITIEYPTEVTVLIVTGRWNIIPREIDRQAEEMFLELDALYRKENPRPVTFSEMQKWEKERLLTIEHRIMEEMIFQLRS